MTTATATAPTRHYAYAPRSKDRQQPTVRYATQRAIGAGYKYDPGPEVTVTYFDTGLVVPLDACPRCGWPTEQEPAFVHCRGCGRLWPVAKASLNAQREFEWASGLIADVPDTDYHVGRPTSPNRGPRNR